MALFRVTISEQVDRLIVVEADDHESADIIAREFIDSNPELDEDGEVIEGITSYGTYTTALETKVEREQA